MDAALLVGASVSLVILGLWCLVLGLRPAEQQLSTGSSTAVWKRWWQRCTTMPRRWKVLVAAGLVGGILAAAVTGLTVLVLVVPVAVVGLPWLLAAPVNRELVLLRALDQWVRLIASSIPTGKSVADAIRATWSQSPAQLRGPLAQCIQRLDGRWSVPDALRAMADELDSPDADQVIAALMLASERGGTGATQALTGLAEATQDRLRAMREVEAERARPRIVVRQITVITVVVLGAAMVVGQSYFEPYRTPVGQVIFGCLLLAYVGALVMLRHKSLPRPRPRILGSNRSSAANSGGTSS